MDDQLIVDFKNTMEKMVATSNQSYENRYGKKRTNATTFSKDSATAIIEGGDIDSQQLLSQNYFDLGGLYSRIITTYATLLKYQGILIPEVKKDKSLTDSILLSKYYSAMDFIEILHIPDLCINFMLKALINGCYYGVIQKEDKGNFSTLDLPVRYCRTLYKDSLNNDIIEFNLQYFEKISDPILKKRALDAYPRDIVKAYHRWQDGKQFYWYMIPVEESICFPVLSGRPPFLSVILDCIDYEEYKTINKKMFENVIKKVLIQEIPENGDKDGFLLSNPEVEALHAGTVGMMKKEPSISVLTTYAKAKIEGSNTVATNTINPLESGADTIFRDASISPNLFAPDGALTYKASVQNNISFLMSVVTKMNTFFTNAINRQFSNASIHFKYEILPISYQNESDYIKNASSLASSGYSFIIPALAMGISQKDLTNIKDLENNILKLGDKLKPLQTSYTQTSQVGAPVKDEPTEKTVKNKQSKNNTGGG